MFLKNKLLLLEDWIELKRDMNNEELLKTLRFISSFNGLAIVSPRFLSFPKDHSLPLYPSNMENPLLDDLINYGEQIKIVTNKVLAKLEKTKSDDAQSYEEIIQIYDTMSRKLSLYPYKKFQPKRFYYRRNKLNEYVWL
ncbi:hypothetical protein BLA29_009297, partial [Euroglyphus maynei]